MEQDSESSCCLKHRSSEALLLNSCFEGLFHSDLLNHFRLSVEDCFRQCLTFCLLQMHFFPLYCGENLSLGNCFREASVPLSYSHLSCSDSSFWGAYWTSAWCSWVSWLFWVICSGRHLFPHHRTCLENTFTTSSKRLGDQLITDSLVSFLDWLGSSISASG